MKKLLSIVLAVAMVISAFAMLNAVSIGAEGEAQTVVGKKLEVTTAYQNTLPYNRTVGNFTADDVVTEDGKSYIPVEYDIYNTSDTAYRFKLQAQAYWTGFNCYNDKNIPAGEKATLSIKIPVVKEGDVWYATKADGTIVEDKHTDMPDGTKRKASIDILYIRIEFADGKTLEYPVGTSYIIALNGADDPFANKNTVSKDGSVGEATLTDVYTLPVIETYNAVKISNNAVTSAGKADFLMKAPFLTAADFGDKDTIDVTYLINNPFDKQISFTVFATEWDSYRDYVYTTNEIDPETNKPTGERTARTDSTLIPANTVGEITVTYAKTGYFYHSNAAILFATGNYLDKMAFRIQCGSEELAAGATIEVAIKDEALNAKFIAAAQDLEWKNGHSHTVTKVNSTAIAEALAVTPTPDASATATATATPTPAPTPNAIEIHALQDNSYYVNSDTGAMTADDIKNGVLTKEITIKNVGENDITVQLCIQATVKRADGSDTWAGFSSGDYIEIATGDSETFTVEVEFEDGVTTINDQEVTVDKLFFRLNFNNSQSFFEGDGVLIYGDLDIVNAYGAKTTTDKLSYEKKIIDIPTNSKPAGTGDALPVALVAALLVSATAFVVVAKKRKED